MLMSDLSSRRHPTALISERAHLAEDVVVGPWVIIHDHVTLGPGSIVGAGCILGEPTADYYCSQEYSNPPLSIGPGALIRSGSILYAGSRIGDNFETGHRATVREHSLIGHHVRLGTNADIQGYCQIGDYVRMHSAVHIGQHTRVGNFVWIFPYAVFTNDPHPPSESIEGVCVEDYAVIGARAVLMPGIQIGEHAVVGAGSVVYRDVPPRMVVAGNPARRIASIEEIKNRVTGEAAYPWPEHFSRGMPWQEMGFARWIQMRDGSS